MINNVLLDLLINVMFAELFRFCWNARISLSGSLEEGSVWETSRRLGLWYVLTYSIFGCGFLSNWNGMETEFLGHTIQLYRQSLPSLPSSKRTCLDLLDNRMLSASVTIRNYIIIID